MSAINVVGLNLQAPMMIFFALQNIAIAFGFLVISFCGSYLM